MDDKKYQACRNKGGKSWNELAEELGLGVNAGERLRSWYKRARRKGNDFGTTSVFPKVNLNEHKSSYTSDGENIFVTYIADHVPTIEEVMEKYSVDANDWKVNRFEVTDWQMGRKDIQKDLNWVEGVVDGYVTDSGKINRVWLHRINVKFIRKTEEIRSRNVIKELINEAKTVAPLYPKINYKKFDRGCLFEVDIPDIHFGRLTWNEESGADYDIKIAEEMVHSVLDKLLYFVSNMDVERIFLPLGNDFFNVNSKMNTTVRGTPQQEDTRYQKTFKHGRQMAVSMIEKCLSIAPVDVMIIAGNHDEERSFYLGDSLESWFHNTKNVTVDNGAKKRKYYQFKNNMIGLTHGSAESIAKLPFLMAMEQPTMWASTKNREWHLGDKHHKKDLLLKSDEGSGMMIRLLRSLVSADAWTFDNGLVGSERAAEGLLWHPEDGVIAQYTAIAK